jgi:hypothetical protein
LQNASPAETRTSTAAIFITISSLVSHSLGPLFVGLLSDLLAAPEEFASADADRAAAVLRRHGSDL